MIHELSFGTEDEFLMGGKHEKHGKAVKQIMGVTDPLEGVRAHTEKSQFMFQVSRPFSNIFLLLG